MAVAIDRGFFAELPTLPEVPAQQADVAWLIYDLHLNSATNRYQLVKTQAVYTQFTPALQLITTSVPGIEGDFLRVLQRKLDEKQVGVSMTSDATSLLDVFAQDESSEE